MTKKLITLTLVCFVYFNTFAQTNKEYSNALKKMFEVSGTMETYQGAIKQMIDMFKKQYSKVDEKVWKEFEKEFSSTSIDELTDLLAPVYEKHMTLADLQELIKFYETPLGKKYAKSIPLITQESMQVGQEWGMKIGQQIAKKMKDKGY